MLTWDVASLFVDWLSRRLLALNPIFVSVTNGMFLRGIFFDFSLFSHSDSYVDVCNASVA